MIRDPSVLATIRQLRERKPFVPFRIVMKSGQRHEVVDPEKMAIAKTQIHLFSPLGEMLSLPRAGIDVVFEPRRARH